MKKHFCAIAMTVVLSAVLGGAKLRAAADETERVNIPFDFQVSSAHMKAGAYWIKWYALPQFIQVDPVGGKTAVVPSRSSTMSHEQSKLVFHKIGDRYFLDGVDFQNQERGRMLPVSRTERELAATQPVTEVYIALR